MISFVNYLLESGISLSLFAMVYFLFLRRETFFHVNRWFLLVSVVFSAVLPLLHLRVYPAQPTVLAEVTVTPYVNLLSMVTVYGNSLTRGAERIVLSYSLFGYIYLAGSAFFALKLFWQILQIIRLITGNKVIADGKIKLVVLERETSPFSFLNYIFVSSHLQETKGWESMLEHEKQHIVQGHSVDVLILELIAVFQWFNPFFWMFRRALRENHEFLADHAVLAKGATPLWYKQMLINQYVGDQVFLANNFNYSLIKSRIKMMSKIKSRKIAGFKILVGFVLAASLVVVFACEQKDTMKNPVSTAGKTVNIELDGRQLQLSGDSVAIGKLESLISESDNYKMSGDVASGKMVLTSQANPVDGVVVVAIGQQEKSSTQDNDPVFSGVDTMPEFAGGELELRKFIARSVKYPVVAQENGTQGKVFVSFVVEKDGSVGGVKIARGVSPEIDKEAMRVVSSMPKWTPGKKKGETVRVAYTIPINFKLQ